MQPLLSLPSGASSTDFPITPPRRQQAQLPPLGAPGLVPGVSVICNNEGTPIGRQPRQLNQQITPRLAQEILETPSRPSLTLGTLKALLEDNHSSLVAVESSFDEHTSLKSTVGDTRCNTIKSLSKTPSPFERSLYEISEDDEPGLINGNLSIKSAYIINSRRLKQPDL